jgi:formamidopyrimidine-DNA glycosylase
MPELPEVEVVRRGLEAAVVGRRIEAVDVRRPDLRFPFPERLADRLSGATVERVERRAKYLLVGLSTAETLIVHLGMTGRISIGAPPVELADAGAAVDHIALAAEVMSRGWTGTGPTTLGAYVYATSALPQHDHLVLALSGGRTLTYNDPRRFGFILMTPTPTRNDHPMLASLGVEPLSDALDAAYLARQAADRRADLKAFLLDQHVIAGLGNIYVCEALFRAGLSPRRVAGCLADRRERPTDRARRLVPEIKAVLEAAIAAGGSSLRDYRHTDGTSGAFQEAFAVYDREGEPCVRPGCTGTVARIVQANRSTFHCPACQR